MPEAVELYGVAWQRNEVGETTYRLTDAMPAEAIYWPGKRNLALWCGQIWQHHPCPTLDRAAMIVALLARPDAQFELVEKEGDDEPR